MDVWRHFEIISEVSDLYYGAPEEELIEFEDDDEEEPETSDYWTKMENIKNNKYFIYD